MRETLRKLSRRIVYALLSNVVYWLVMYFGYTWLAARALFYGYLWNLAFILVGLLADEATHRMFRSKKFVQDIQKELAQNKNQEKFFRLARRQVQNFVSFKAVLYVFSVLILIFSQVSNFFPAFLGESLRSFIRANDSMILILLAFDALADQLDKDEHRLKRTREAFQRNLAETKSTNKEEGEDP